MLHPGVSSQRTSLVSGAASGIGRRFAEALAARGDRLVLVDVDEPALMATLAALPGKGHQAHVVDLASADALEGLRAELHERLPRLDLLVNCAGILGAGPFAEQPIAAFARVVQVNLMGTVHLTHACLPLLARGRGHVVNLASTASLHGWPMLAAYSAAKSAVASYSEAIRAELSRLGVGLTAVFPLLVDTPMLRREPTPPILRGPRVDAAEVVERTLRAVERRRARLYVPSLARLVAVVHGLAPPVLDWWGAKQGFPAGNEEAA